MLKKYIYFFLPLFLFLAAISGCTGVNESVSKTSGAENNKDAAIGEAPQRVVTQLILGPGDKLEISVYKAADLTKNVTIDYTGRFTYPFVGDVDTTGLSVFQLRDKIRDGLSKYFKNPQVSINLTAVQSQKLIILGEVKSPGYFQIDSPLTVIDAMSKAGGATIDGKIQTVVLIRGGLKKPELKVLDIEKALSTVDMRDNVYLQPGDILYVPRTFISNVDRFFGHLSTIISPIISLEGGYYVGQQIQRNTGSSPIQVH